MLQNLYFTHPCFIGGGKCLAVIVVMEGAKNRQALLLQKLLETSYV